MIHIFLIRHGESITNVGENFVDRTPDHLVSLTQNGIKQAHEAGEWLANYCDEKKICFDKARIWRSPYVRTRQTSEEFNYSLKIKDVKEDITLIEQRYGLFDATPVEQWGELFPKEYAEYQRQMQNQGKFYARMPLGESPYDVAIRIHPFMGTIHRDYKKHDIDTLFVFTHGTTLRTFLLRWFHYTPEWYHEERNPKNCWIRELTNHKDYGYINS